jgi:hypothetical protein
MGYYIMGIEALIMPLLMRDYMGSGITEDAYTKYDFKRSPLGIILRKIKIYKYKRSKYK